MDTKLIRKQMKEVLGYTSRQVSVKDSGRGAIWFTIKTVSVNYEKLAAFVKRFENISIDRNSGEILGGGNFYCFINRYEG